MGGRIVLYDTYVKDDDDYGGGDMLVGLDET